MSLESGVIRAAVIIGPLVEGTKMANGECGIAACCWRRKRDQAVSWRALVNFFNILILLAVMESKVAANLASDTTVLLEIKRIWRNPAQLSSWSNSTPTCSGQWFGVSCDEQNTTVTMLQLSGTNLKNAAIPPIIGNLTNLTELFLDLCNLAGEIPKTIGALKSLVLLNFDTNGLQGTIPAEIGELTNLTSLILSSNNLSGDLPDLSRLQSVLYLDLGPNSALTGPFPRWIGTLSQLRTLGLHGINLTGTILPEIGNLTNLSSMNLESCGLVGDLPTELGNMKSLTELLLPSNGFTGNIPESFKNLRNLTTLNLIDNKMTGFLPSWLTNLSFLEEIFLDGNSFAGPIPQEIGTISHLTKITMRHNNLIGDIPASLGSLVNLTLLALEFNRLSGPIPPSILSLPNLQRLSLDNNCLNGSAPGSGRSITIPEFTIADNCFDGSSQPCKCAAALNNSTESFFPSTSSSSSSSNSTIYISVGVVAGTLLTLGILILIFLRSTRRREKSPPPAPGSVRHLELSDIVDATKNFTDFLGKGGQATVYKAEFKDGEVAAVKRFGQGVDQKRVENAVKTFDQEVRLLSRLNHRYLVNLTGYCQHEGEYMLLFDYMDMGSLYDHLHGIHSAKTVLTWDQRVAIVVCVACGIDYLHYGCSPPVFHRDIKSANILLSSKPTFTAKVADFGLGKLTTIDSEGEEDVDVTATPPKPGETGIKGSHGYMDPEFLRTGRYSEKSDIFSYGVVILELITGRKALEKGYMRMTDWVGQYLEEPEELMKIVDPKLKDEFIAEELLTVAEIARSCIDLQPNNRPTIRDVLHRLRTDLKRQMTDEATSGRAPSSTVDFSGLEITEVLPNNSINVYTESEIVPRE
ncbi:hypothetical protein R1flu_023802 [Riccia fluitans]|uniref:Protein kinase domain-containing protein n=1 Tax=Riccia fluitans TaxID=41844 RepID=A0ABD1XT24_9MARC